MPPGRFWFVLALIVLMVWVHLLSAVASFVERRAVHCGKLSVVIPVPLLGGPRSQVWVLDWGNIIDMKNQVLPLERRSGYVRKTPRQAIQALRREIGSRGRDPSQGAVRPAQRAVPRPRWAGGGIWIGYIFLDDLGRAKPAFPNSTGVMYPSVE